MRRMLPLALAGLVVCACDDERRDEGSGVEQCAAYCTVGSGFPCECSKEGNCNDGSTCGVLDPEDTVGICMPPCAGDSDCATHLPCAARPRCAMVSQEDGELYCGYFCRFSEECPKNMYCRGGGDDGEGVCSPRQ